MTQKHTHATRREELLIGFGSQLTEIQARIVGNRNGIVDSKRKAADHSQWQRHDEAHQEMRHAGQLQAQITADEQTLRDIEHQRDTVVRGNHPELTALSLTGHMASVESKQGERTEAKAAFDALLTPELRQAARRYVEAARAADPLAPIPTLADAIAEGA